MCKFNRIYRYESYRALKHPWVTRSVKSNIPLTMLESYSKQDLIKKFKFLLGTLLFMPIFKVMNKKLFKITKDIINITEDHNGSDLDKSNVYNNSACYK